MKRFMKRAIAIVMAMATAVMCTLPAFAEAGGIVIDAGNYKLSKVTSPYAGKGQADGLGSGTVRRVIAGPRQTTATTFTSAPATTRFTGCSTAIWSALG
ncbi:MAG: hypothetical protein ACLSAP_02085 [Oscillospiraceae bacterium]